MAAPVGTWMVTIGASGVRIPPIIVASFLVISGAIAVTWGMDTTERSLTQLERKYGRETSHPAARTA